MKLPFGIKEGKFIHISEVSSGRAEVLCPYCHNKLIAKKGRIKRHHFAHDGIGCTQHFSANFFDLAGRLPTKLALSVYATQKLTKIEQFYQQLIAGKEGLDRQKNEEQVAAIKAKLVELKAAQTITNTTEIIEQIDRFVNHKIAPFPDFHTLRSETFNEGYTDGKRTCTISEIKEDKYEFFYPKIFQKAVAFLHNYHQKTYSEKEIVYKLALFEKDLAYFQQFNLYFLEVVVDHQKIYKIGLTSRPLNTRIKEIEQALKAFYLTIEITVLFQHKGVAFLETFFKNKYANKQVKIGQLTEYFSFSKEEAHLVLKDLNLLKFKEEPNRSQKEWIDWLFFNFNGKIYGYVEKSVYVNNEKYLLTKQELAALQKLQGVTS